MRPILVDVDGVLCNFVGKCVDFVNEKKGLNILYTEVKKDICSYDWWDKECEDFVCAPGFCLEDMLPYQDGIEGIKTLRKFGHKIVFVTSPYSGSPTWAYDRLEWLKKHFDATRDDVIFCHDKRYIDGTILIDDRPRNVYDWENYGFNFKVGLLFDTPQNIDLGKYSGYNFIRASSWKGIVNYINDSLFPIMQSARR